MPMVTSSDAFAIEWLIFSCPMLVMRGWSPGIRSGLKEKKGAIKL